MGCHMTAHVAAHPRCLRLPTSLAKLPTEIIQIITSYLPNSDIKTLRLTCKPLCNTVQLRLNRVFLSANPLNLAVFLAIANNDARFVKLPPDVPFHEIDKESGCPEWLVSECKENIENRWMRKGSNIDRHIYRAKQIAAKMTMKQCWQYFQNLFYEQDDVISGNKDAEALRYGLPRLPALKRVTITPVAHGWIFNPLYETPMIRAFPKGFNYPIPRGWPHIPGGDLKPAAEAWENKGARKQFRGFGIVTRALTDYMHHQVSEFVIDVNYLDTGLNCCVFEQPSFTEYQDFATILCRPGFTRLGLALLVNNYGLARWPSFRSRYLHRALSEARGLEHISLHTNVGPDPRAQFVPMRTVFPVDNWPSLRHFELSGLIVDKDDLVAFLATLPSTLHSVHLSFLYFPDNRGSWRELLEDMREKLDWRTRRDPVSRPKVTVGTPTQSFQIGHAVWIEQEVQAFLYGESIRRQRR
ncbi:hypothetical protein BJX63DRAFT_417418 [Aspergillus granulosus]|uniref:F-box domain-containing protein n=1 Tax=Aspergillus granulosus TaxID=176169 RepID=A0ABR4I817_9EURO